MTNTRAHILNAWVPPLLIAAGAILCALTLLNPENHPRFAAAWLWAFSFTWSVVLGSLFFVILHHLTGSVWSVVIRRIAEMLAAPMFLLVLLFLPLLLFAVMNSRFHLFPWLDAAHVQADPLLQAKRPYLNLPFFTVRAAAFFALWIVMSLFFLRRSLRQDAQPGETTLAASLRRGSAPAMLIFAFTVAFASFDWLMSLDPHWYSTIFPVYIFSGMVLGALAALTLATLAARRAGRLGVGLVRPDHLYNLGGLLFAFTCFWAYIAFSQFMLIWYGNLPEETSFFARRLSGAWRGVSIALVLLRFVLPFFILLSRRAKMSVWILVPTALLVLLGQGLDLYWLIMPHTQTAPLLGWQELGPPLLMIGLLLLALRRFTARHNLLPQGDGDFDRSCQFHL